MTGTLEEDMLDMLLDPLTTSTPTTPEYRNDEDIEVQVLNTETIDLEGTQKKIELLEDNTAQKLDNLIKTTRNILDIESDTDEYIEELVSNHPAVTRRKIAAHNLKCQADRMVTRGKGILPPLKVGDNVLVSIPSVDRGRGDAANLLSVVMEEKDGKFRIATKEGTLNTWLERNSLAATKYCSLTTTDVQSNEYSLRELVRLGSVGTGQGYRRCTCRTNCTSKKCTCRKNDMMGVPPRQ
ncbi:unnamed protein product [Macrosiphum euphorbiae]|nr:unnamed protein product [Macrosiphum euphorbiae]